MSVQIKNFLNGNFPQPKKRLNENPSQTGNFLNENQTHPINFLHDNLTQTENFPNYDFWPTFNENPAHTGHFLQDNLPQPKNTPPDTVTPKKKPRTAVRPKMGSGKISLLAQGTGDPELDKIIAMAGYSYDPAQDIFISNMNPWQRDVGYCHLYDEASAPMGMIIDCEPVYFIYRGIKWMIGFWKGQYDYVTGGEIGIYREALDLDIPGLVTGVFYTAVSDADLIHMSFTLKKNGKTLFTREDKHWWLTGFRLGEFSEPSELQMEIKITLEDAAMCEAFISGMQHAGYKAHEYSVNENTVNFTFAKPHNRQPFTRTPFTDGIIQHKNKLFCDKFQEITKGCTDIICKFKAVEDQAPEMFERTIKFGRTKKLNEQLNYLILISTSILSRITKTKKITSEITFSDIGSQVLMPLDGTSED